MSQDRAGSAVPGTAARWRTAILVLILVLFSSACYADPGSEPVFHLVILHTNDTHGHPLKFPFGRAPDAGGLPARASAIEQIRKTNPNVLLLDAGDLNTGRSESNLFKARPDIEGYNYVRYDAMALGNHEFDNPPRTLKEQMSIARFPFLSSNIRKKDGGFLARPYLIKEFSGFRVAIFGLTLKETPMLANPENVKDLLFLDEVDTARELVPKLRQQADFVIALTHLGIFDSPERGSRRLASEVSGIDVVVDGHTHTLLDSPIVVRNPSGRKSLIVQAWKWGLVLGRLDLWIQGGMVKDFRFESIPINLGEMQPNGGAGVHRQRERRIAEDPALLKLLQPYAEETRLRLSEVIGFAGAPFPSKNVLNQETAIGDLVADSMQWFAEKWGTDFAVQNGGGIRQDLPAGPVTLKSIYDMLPFENSVYILSLDGAQLRRLFDFVAAIPEGSGAFPQFSKEVSAVFNRKTRRSEKVLIHGEPIRSGRTYRIATHSYLAGGGDGYKLFLNAKEREDTAVFQQPVLIDYIKSLGGRLNPTTGNRITIRP